MRSIYNFHKNSLPLCANLKSAEYSPQPSPQPNSLNLVSSTVLNRIDQEFDRIFFITAWLLILQRHIPERMQCGYSFRQPDTTFFHYSSCTSFLARELSWNGVMVTILIDRVTDSPSRVNVSEFTGRLMSLQQATFYCSFWTDKAEASLSSLQQQRSMARPTTALQWRYWPVHMVLLSSASGWSSNWASNIEEGICLADDAEEVARQISKYFQ